MFTNISLCPGGAMMFHETVAEFDPNVESSPLLNKETSDNNEVIKTALKEVPTNYCPIGSMVEKLRPCYELVQELARTPLNPDTREEAYQTLEKISSSVSTISETIRMCLVKQKAVLEYVTGSDDWMYEPLKEHLGWFIKNYNRIIGHGYGIYTRDITYFAPLEHYQVTRALNLFMSSVEGLTVVPFDISRLYDITNYDRSSRVFSSTEDLLDCIFNDRDRFDRLTKHNTDSTELECLINNRCTTRDVVCVPDYSRHASLINYISHILRLVKCGCYDLQCELTDSDVSSESIITRIRPLMIGAINIFYIGAIKLFSNAIELKNVFDGREALKLYVETVMSSLR